MSIKPSNTKVVVDEGINVILVHGYFNLASATSLNFRFGHVIYSKLVEH